MSELIATMIEQFAAQSIWEMIAVVLALAYVWLAARQNIWCWPAALISTTIYVWLFWDVTLPFHAGLNAYYVAMAFYGWWQWKKPEKSGQQVAFWSAKKHLASIAFLACVSVLLSFGASQVLDADYLYLDAFITVFSVFTTYLVTQKIIENWIYWMVINMFAAFLYFQKDLYLTSGLFLLYFAFAIYGYLNWRRDFLSQKASNLSVSTA